MQIILLEKVVNLGNLGEVVKVKDGYARNFLIPQRKARRATADRHRRIRSQARRTGKSSRRKTGSCPGARRKTERR